MDEWDACEDYREALVSVCQELDETKQYIVQLLEDMQDEPASWAVMSLRAYIMANTHKWYGGNYDAWERAGYERR